MFYHRACPISTYWRSFIIVFGCAHFPDLLILPVITKQLWPIVEKRTLFTCILTHTHTHTCLAHTHAEHTHSHSQTPSVSSVSLAWSVSPLCRSPLEPWGDREHARAEEALHMGPTAPQVLLHQVLCQRLFPGHHRPPHLCQHGHRVHRGWVEATPRFVRKCTVCLRMYSMHTHDVPRVYYEYVNIWSFSMYVMNILT